MASSPPDTGESKLNKIDETSAITKSAFQLGEANKPSFD